MPIPVKKLTTRTDLTKERILDMMKKNKGLGFTQKELAKILDLDQATISRNLLNLMKRQKIWKRFEKKGRGRKTAYYCIRDESYE